MKKNQSQNSAIWHKECPNNSLEIDELKCDCVTKIIIHWRRIKVKIVPYALTRGPLVLYRSPECWGYLISAVIDEKKFKHSPWAGSDNPLGPVLMSTGRPHHDGHLLQSKKISNDQELIQSDPTSYPQNQKGNN